MLISMAVRNKSLMMKYFLDAFKRCLPVHRAYIRKSNIKKGTRNYRQAEAIK